MPRRRLTAKLGLAAVTMLSIVVACAFFHDDLLFKWDDFTYTIPEDLVDKRIADMVKNRGCSSRELRLLDDYCTRSGAGGLYADGGIWSLFVRDPEMIRRIHAVDSMGKIAFGILYNGPSCYLEYHGQIPQELAAKATGLYHHNLASYLPDTTGLQKEWDRVFRDPRLSTQAPPQKTDHRALTIVAAHHK